MNTFRCLKPNGVYTNVTWRFFFVKCPKANLQCNANSGAYVPAITVCNQQLF
jgi:hypothetical protein